MVGRRASLSTLVLLAITLALSVATQLWLNSLWSSRRMSFKSASDIECGLLGECIPFEWLPFVVWFALPLAFGLLTGAGERRRWPSLLAALFAAGAGGLLMILGLLQEVPSSDPERPIMVFAQAFVTTIAVILAYLLARVGIFLRSRIEERGLGPRGRGSDVH